MKNTFLKKAVATALAAVMAVTFAPVASLNAFAAENDQGVTAATDSGVIGVKTNEGTVNKPGTYTVYARTNEAVTVTLTTANMEIGTYNFKVQGGFGNQEVDFKITGADKDVNINIEGVPTATYGQVYLPRIDLSDDLQKPIYNKLDVKLTGNMWVVDFEDVDKSATVKRNLTTKTPVATVVENVEKDTTPKGAYIGNVAISAAQWIDSNPVQVVAYNGPVEVYKLKPGSSAIVNANVYHHGTSIKASAYDKTALAKVSTTINFKYVVRDNDNYSVTLPGTYTEDAYYSGKDTINEGVQNAVVPCRTTGVTREIDYETTITGDPKGRTSSSLKVQLIDVDNANKLLDDEAVEEIIKRGWTNYTTDTADRTAFVKFGNIYWGTDATRESYSQAITVNMNGDDWKGGTLDAYVSDVMDTRKNGSLSGETYYTMDPSAFTKSEDGVAKVDGTKYFVSSHDQLNELQYVGGANAEKSVDILRGTEVKATDGNDLAYDTFENENDLTVTAPADMSLVKADQDNVTGRYQWNTKEWRAFGSKRHSGRDMSEQEYAFPYKKRGTTKTNNNIYVAQVASGSTMTVYVDPRVKVTKADDLGFFETDVFEAQKGNDIVGSDWQAVTFGDVANVTKKFVSSVKSQKSEAEYYASKEIKTVVAGVDPDVVIKGEINADVTDTAANGTKTWDVNTNAAKEKSQVTAHRMYSGREHVYTADPKEIEMLVAAGWKDEGPAFTVNAVASGKGTPIYRLYNKNNGGMHFYTASAAEKDMLLANGWTEGKPVFYGADKATGIPVYRTYNTGSNNGEHNYTTNMAEVEMNVQKGWRAEGVAFYVFK